MKPKVIVESFRKKPHKPHKPLSKGGHPIPFSFIDCLIRRRNGVSATMEHYINYDAYNDITYKPSEDEEQT